ncbi:class I SAM-dependent methyltransferase [Spongiivirga citrea]|uniref:Methyltransferase domain-containing protein n=1 Tax=Spongiivirga citrea TaxID=1481457 RepID=A0A6M0CEC7_9FLAO|nr:class I SAM-dependent methyltransferase [Spongiivirga citrea]NER16091.1 methyltransferase domain-containing protein [Spongiivirga citrea]
MKKKENSPSKTKMPWPTADAMKQIYEMKLWGGNNTPFYSGDGSHDTAIVNPYIAVVISFLKSFQSPLVVCDLGCGDFNIGKQLIEHTKKYIAIDIVPDLIGHNKQQFQNENLEFKCLDIAKDDLPKGDCAIIRQVLQHLSNVEVQGVLDKLTAYKYVILTEHIPTGKFTPNKDIISGQGIRLKKQSGLDILAAPLRFKVKSEKELQSYYLEDGKGLIRTLLYEVL